MTEHYNMIFILGYKYVVNSLLTVNTCMLANASCLVQPYNVVSISFFNFGNITIPTGDTCLPTINYNF